MLANITNEAQLQLLLLADAFQIPQDQVVFKIEGKMRMPARMIWYMDPVTSYDSRFDLWEKDGFRFAVERTSSIFLVGVTIDYDVELLKDNKLYAPTDCNAGKPVWPRGFVFEDQKFQNTLT